MRLTKVVRQLYNVTIHDNYSCFPDGILVEGDTVTRYVLYVI